MTRSITFYHVYNTLGYGFLEKVYENAMVVELTKRNLMVDQQHPIKVHYEGHSVGEYFADLLVEDTVIVELKAAEQIAKEHEAQLVNYLRATQIEVGLLLNFGVKPQVRRKVFDNARKTAWNAETAETEIRTETRQTNDRSVEEKGREDPSFPPFPRSMSKWASCK